MLSLGEIISWIDELVHFLGQLYTYREIRENDSEMHSRVFRVTFLAFRILRPGWNSRENSKGFRGLFFLGTNKTRNSHEIRKVYSALYFAACFAKTFAKYLQNVKHEKCITSLIVLNNGTYHGFDNFYFEFTAHSTFAFKSPFSSSNKHSSRTSSVQNRSVRTKNVLETKRRPLHEIGALILFRPRNF